MGPGWNMQIDRIDHFVLTVADIQATCDFYSHALGMDVVTFGEGRKALTFGSQKINLHQKGKEYEPKAACPMPGSADICFIASNTLHEVAEHLNVRGISIIDGPVTRTSATGPIISIYIRDPDSNLIEISNYSSAKPLAQL